MRVSLKLFIHCSWLLQETQKEASEATSLDVYLMNGHKITIKIMSTDQTEDVLEVIFINHDTFPFIMARIQIL